MILTLSSESVRNTVFTDEHGLPVFKSETPFNLGIRTTTIYRQRMPTSGGPEIGDNIEVMGRIDWRWLGPSIFTIGDRRLESDTFLPRHGLLGRKRTFTGPDGCHYRWDMHRRDVVLSLDDASRMEIARYHRATLGIIGRRKSARLEIAPQASHMLDLITLTFIYVEKLRMDKERRRRHAGGAGGGL